MILPILSTVILLVVSGQTTSSGVTLNDDTLKAVVIIVRHGDRSPEYKFYFPNEPKSTRKQWPYELEELTQEGIMQMYHVGKRLRKRYGFLVDNKYVPSKVRVTADTNRTMDSASALLAAMFPQNYTDKSNPMSVWRPIPVHTDLMIKMSTLAVLRVCDKVQTNVTESYTYLERLVHYTPFIQEAERLSGDIIYPDLPRLSEDYCDLLLVRDIHREISPPPVWADNQTYLEMAKEIKADLHHLALSWPYVQKISAGYFMKTIIDGFDELLSNRLDTRIKIISAHDSTLELLNYAAGAGIFNATHLPGYGAFLMFELHQTSNNLPYIRMKGSSDYQSPIQDLPITKCGTDPCGFDDFKLSMPQTTMHQFWQLCQGGDAEPLFDGRFKFLYDGTSMVELWPMQTFDARFAVGAPGQESANFRLLASLVVCCAVLFMFLCVSFTRCWSLKQDLKEKRRVEEETGEQIPVDIINNF